MQDADLAVDYRYTLEKEALAADEDGSVSHQFYFTSDAEDAKEDSGKQRLILGRSVLAKGGTYLHSTGWSSYSPTLRNFLRTHVRYKPTDIVISTFPKCGTTLTEQVVLLLLNGGDAGALDPLSKNSANLTGKLGKVWPEACLRSPEDIERHDGTGPEEFLPKTVEWFDALPEPRVIKTHARVGDLLGRVTSEAEAEGDTPLVPGAKYVVCTRNPLDACVSCFHHAWNPAKCGWPFPAWVEAWLRSDETSGCGSWMSWHQAWWHLHQQQQQQAQSQILWCYYESMLSDPHAEVRRIAAFLEIDADEALVARVVEGSSFQSMKAAAVSAASASKRSNTDAHLRSGQSCKWRSHFYQAACSADTDADAEAGAVGAAGVSPSAEQLGRVQVQEEGDRLKRLATSAFQQALGGSGVQYPIGEGELLE